MKTERGNFNSDTEVKLHWLILGELVTWIGASFIWPLTSVYLNKQLHVSLSMIGVVLFFNCVFNGEIHHLFIKQLLKNTRSTDTIKQSKLQS